MFSREFLKGIINSGCPPPTFNKYSFYVFFDLDHQNKRLSHIKSWNIPPIVTMSLI